VEAPPTAVRVGRFDRSLLQFPVGHVDRLAAVDAALTAEAPGLLLAGAIRHGVGIPACVRSGNEAAERAVGILG
jgi:oxygen-dependent protoporphyrinogen oxidase